MLLTYRNREKAQFSGPGVTNKLPPTLDFSGDPRAEENFVFCVEFRPVVGSWEMVDHQRPQPNTEH
jgi:hypothetical protein